MRCPFEKSGMDVEYIPRKSFAARWSAKQKGKLAIGACVLGQIVVDDENIASRFHEVFCDTGRSIGRNVGQAWRIVAFADHDDTKVHRPSGSKFGDRFGYGRCALADRAVNADDVLTALVQYGINGDGRLSGLAISQD